MLNDTSVKLFQKSKIRVDGYSAAGGSGTLSYCFIIIY